MSILAHPFMRNAYLAGTAIAVLAGLVGYFVVLRSQVFTGDALSHVAFTGALAALAAGVDARIGLFAATVVVGGAMGAIARRGRADDVVVGNVFAWVLGVGVLMLTLYTTSGSTANSTAGVNVLFGSIFGLSAGEARLAAVVAAALVVAVLAMARPLLFSSVDEAVAAARGVPVRALGVVFLALVGATAGEATQAVGALLLLGLLAAPAGAALLLTARPYRAMWLSAGLAVGSVWTGLGLSYLVPSLPPSFAILAVAAAFYGAASVRRRARPPLSRPAPRGRAGADERQTAPGRRTSSRGRPGGRPPR
ncbi:MAG TPA: metal ABC transporter permease [Acidimicrobiales bacterium]|nr:metal ABC transporter permease [Acidimicrobiales bacterium]